MYGGRGWEWMYGRRGREATTHSRYPFNVSSGFSYSYPKAKVAKREQNHIPHQLLHLGAWSHFLEDLGAIQSLPGPGNACTSLLFSAAVTAQGQGSSRGQLSCLIPGSHQSMPFTPSLFLHFFFFLYNEASRDWWTSEPRYGSLGSPASIKAGKPGKVVETVTGKLVGNSRKGGSVCAFTSLGLVYDELQLNSLGPRFHRGKDRNSFSGQKRP